MGGRPRTARAEARALERSLGLEILEIEAPDQAGGGPRVTIGDELAPGLVARFSRQFGRDEYDEATIEYLKSIDGAGAEAVAPLDSAQMQPYLGTYAGDGGDVIVAESRFGLTLQGRDQNAVRLTRTGEHTFHPAGAQNVRVAFTMLDGAATRVEITEADWFVSAVRGR